MQLSSLIFAAGFFISALAAPANSTISSGSKHSIENLSCKCPTALKDSHLHLFSEEDPDKHTVACDYKYKGKGQKDRVMCEYTVKDQYICGLTKEYRKQKWENDAYYCPRQTLTQK